MLTPAGNSTAPSLSIPYYLRRGRVPTSMPTSPAACRRSTRAPTSGSATSAARSPAAPTSTRGACRARPPASPTSTRARSACSRTRHGSDASWCSRSTPGTRFSNAAAGTFEIDLFLTATAPACPTTRSSPATTATDTTRQLHRRAGRADLSTSPPAVARWSTRPTRRPTARRCCCRCSPRRSACRRRTRVHVRGVLGRRRDAGAGHGGLQRVLAVATNALYYTVPPGVSGTVPVALDPVQWQTSPALGLMIVSQDNASGPAQAALLRADR